MPIKPEKDANNLAFAERLVRLLEKNGKPRHGAGASLARKYKVSSVTANAWLNGEHKMEIDLARKIAQDHGSTFEELYFGERTQDTDAATEPRVSELHVMGLFRELDSKNFVALVIQALPDLCPSDRIAIAQAALIDLPTFPER